MTTCGRFTWQIIIHIVFIVIFLVGAEFVADLEDPSYWITWKVTGLCIWGLMAIVRILILIADCAVDPDSNKDRSDGCIAWIGLVWTILASILIPHATWGFFLLVLE